MKKFNKFFLITFFISMPWISQACEFTKIPVGTPVANLIEEYDVLPEPDPDYADDTIYKYTFNARTFCDNNELKDAILYVFLQNFELIAMKFETYHNDIKKKDLRLDNPYNTYRYKGLPPGPISTVSEDSLKAALNPLKTDFLYFVSMGNGFHKFSKTLSEHNEAVLKYQINGR